MKLLLKIFFFILSIFETNISEAKVFVFKEVVWEEVFCNILNSEKSQIEFERFFLENDIANTCKSENNLINYRNWGEGFEAVATKTGFKTLNELGLKDGMTVSSSKSLELGEQFLGKGYKEVIHGEGRFVSADGTRVFRMGVNDITGKLGGGPHVNFETLIVNPAKPGKMMVDQNFHIYLIH